MTDTPAPVPERARRRLAAVGTTSALALVLALAIAQPWAAEPVSAVEPKPEVEPTSTGSRPTGSIQHPQALRCGLPVPTVHELDESVPLRLVPRVLAGHVPHGAAVPEDDPSWQRLAGVVLDRNGEYSIAVDLVNESATAFEAALRGSTDAWGYPPDVLLAQDGMIVGSLTQLYSDLVHVSPTSTIWAPGASTAVGSRSRVGDCGGFEAPLLVPGEYEAYVAVDLLTPVGPAPNPLDQPLGGDYWTTLVGGPYPVTITGEAREPEPDPAWTEDVRAGRRPALDGMRVGYDGLGTLMVGNQVPTEPAATNMIRRDEAFCEGADPGRWVPVYDMGPRPAGDEPWFAVSVVERVTPRLDGSELREDVIARIDTVGFATDQGVGPGATLAEVQAAYPGLALERDAAETGWEVDSWRFDVGAGAMVFDVAAAADGPSGFGRDRVGTVVGIAVLYAGEYDRPVTTGVC